MRVWPLLALLLAIPATAEAGMAMKVKEKCAIGGEPFSYTTTPSYSTFGARPDGKPYGSWTFPMELPVCPKNGLVMYREFSKDELARLPAIIATPEYAALRPAETPYYRAAWLARALDPQSLDHAWLLLSASWEADTDAAKKTRYQAEFLAAAGEAPRTPASLNWLALQVRAINARRELGRFDEAAAALKALPLDALATKPGKAADSPDPDEENRQGWRELITSLGRVIARRDASSEPLDMIPTDYAAALCVGVPDHLPRRDDPYCADPSLAEPIAKFREQLAKADKP
jgi:hypothetical protein